MGRLPFNLSVDSRTRECYQVRSVDLSLIRCLMMFRSASVRVGNRIPSPFVSNRKNFGQRQFYIYLGRDAWGIVGLRFER